MKKRIAKKIFVWLVVLLMSLNFSFLVQADSFGPVMTESELRQALVDAGAGDTILIGANIDLTDALVVGKEIVIQSKEGNVFTLRHATTATRHFNVIAGGKLTLQNIILDGENAAGGVNIFGNGEFVMNAGTVIQNCRATKGAGVYLTDSSTFTMNGGVICDNRAFDIGGGICVDAADSTFIMNGGLIDQNKANSRAGGGLALLSGNAELYAGTFTNNTSVIWGGAIYTAAGTTLTFYNTSITDNTASAEGGGLWVCPAGDVTFGDFSDVILYDNQAPEFCGQDIRLDERDMTTVDLTNKALGGGHVIWYDEVNDCEITNFVNLTVKLSLTAMGLSSTDKANAQSLAKVFISNNASAYGGGIAANGVVKFGRVVEKVGLWVQKCWDFDKENPEITVYLLVGGVIQTDEHGQEMKLVLNKDNHWTDEFTDLDFKNDTGTVIEYRVKEDVPEGYEVTYGEMRFNETENRYEITITNETLDRVTLAVEKIWEGDQEEQRPLSIEVFLVKNNVVTGISIVLDKSNNWRSEFTGLARWDDDGEITYAVVEVMEAEYQEYYQTTYSEMRYENGVHIITITNTRETVIEPGERPGTGDTMPAAWLALLGLSVVGVGGSMVYGRRQRRRNRA